MKRTYLIAGIVSLVYGCSLDKGGDEKSRGPVKETTTQKEENGKTLGKLTVMPVQIGIVTSTPTSILKAGEMTIVTGVSERICFLCVTNDGAKNTVRQSNDNEESLVFDLSKALLDKLDLQNQDIAVREMYQAKILLFNTNSTPLILKVENLPTGAMARTVFLTVRCTNPNRSYLLGYGRAEPRASFSFWAQQTCTYTFSAYAHDAGYAAEEERWYALCATYDGKQLCYYVNADKIKTMDGRLDTYPSPVITIGSAFNGAIADVKIWNRLLTEDKIKAETKESLSPLE